MTDGIHTASRRSILRTATLLAVTGTAGCGENTKRSTPPLIPTTQELEVYTPTPFEETPEPTPVSGSKRPGYGAVEPYERAVAEAVNEYRRSNGKRELEYREKAAYVARLHSQDQYEKEYVSHTQPDGENPSDRLNKWNVKGRAHGENIAYFGIRQIEERPTEEEETPALTATEYVPATPQEVAQQSLKVWKASSSHDEGMLRDWWHWTGVGIVIAEDGSTWVTQVFTGKADADD